MSDILYIDSTGNVDENNCRFFQIFLHSPLGGLPVGVLITTSETEEVLRTGFRAWRDLLPENAFHGKTSPTVIMTDDYTSERNALKDVFPNARHLLCTFHMLTSQTMHRLPIHTLQGIRRAEEQ